MENKSKKEKSSPMLRTSINFKKLEYNLIQISHFLNIDEDFETMMYHYCKIYGFIIKKIEYAQSGRTIITFETNEQIKLLFKN